MTNLVEVCALSSAFLFVVVVVIVVVVVVVVVLPTDIKNNRFTHSRAAQILATFYLLPFTARCTQRKARYCYRKYHNVEVP